MPGRIDAHWHAFVTLVPVAADPAYLHLLAARQAEATLMRGFSTVRDLGGPVFELKQAIDEDEDNDDWPPHLRVRDAWTG